MVHTTSRSVSFFFSKKFIFALGRGVNQGKQHKVSCGSETFYVMGKERTRDGAKALIRAGRKVKTQLLAADRCIVVTKEIYSSFEAAVFVVKKRNYLLNVRVI